MIWRVGTLARLLEFHLKRDSQEWPSYKLAQGRPACFEPGGVVPRSCGLRSEGFATPGS